MKTVRIVHIADLHLGSAFAYLDSQRAKQRRQELLCRFRDCVELVKKTKADVFLIAGDLFDNWGCVEAMEYVQTALSTIPETKVFIAAGNHDPKSKVYDQIDWGVHVHIFGGELQKVSLPGVDIYGASLLEAYQPESMMKNVAVDPDKINLLVWHGDLAGGTCNPVTQSQLMMFDYAALGHIHKTEGVRQVASSHWAYAGIPEGRGFDEETTGGAIIGEVGKHIAKLHMEKIEKRHCMSVEVDAQGKTAVQIQAEIAQLLTPDDLYQVMVTGNKDISTEFLEEELSGQCFYLKIKSKKEENEDYASMQNDTTLKGLFIKEMINHMNGENDELCRQAIRAGLRALEGRELFD